MGPESKIMSKVYLVGAGPGDPDLLTIKALKVIQAAKAVVYDRLVGEEIINLIPAQAMRVFVGKETGRHHMPQEEINKLLVSLAKAGHVTVRLKGGDPYIFGRGGEEALCLARHGVAFEVIPGVTAAAACASSVGVPLTHRGFATGVRFITGHAQEDKELELAWDKLADPDCTLVIYMGLANAGKIASKLIQGGLSADTPAMIVERGATKDERVIKTELSQLAEQIISQDVKPPALMIIGKVVDLSLILSAKISDHEISLAS